MLIQTERIKTFAVHPLTTQTLIAKYMSRFLVLIGIAFFSFSTVQAQYVQLDPNGEALAEFVEKTDFRNIDEAQRAFISYVVLDNIPFLKASGNQKWDLASGPDLQLVIKDTQGNVIANSEGPVVTDIIPQELPLYFELNAQVSDFERVYVVEVYDYDATGSDFMFRTSGVAAADLKESESNYADLLNRQGQSIGAVYFRFE